MGDSGKAGCPSVVWDGRELDWASPEGCREYLRGVGDRYLRGRPFTQAHQRLLAEYKPGRRYKLALIIPCSYGKPYSQSYIHYMIRRAIAGYIRRGLIHEIIVTNAGVVPRELDEYWPYTAYDWNSRYETPEIRECYTSVLAERLTDYIQAYQGYYDMWAAYLRWDSDSWKAVQIAAERTGLEIPNLAAETVPQEELEEAGLGLGYDQDPDTRLITPTSLNTLKRRLKEILGE